MESMSTSSILRLFKPVQSITGLDTTALGTIAVSTLVPGTMAWSAMALEQPIAIR